MSRFLYFMLPAFCLFYLAGCASSGGIKESGNPASQTNVSQNIGTQLLTAIQVRDYKQFSSVLAGRTNFNIQKKDFDTSAGSLEEKYGKIVSWDYMTELKTPLVTNQIWKVRFVRTLPESNTEQEQDMLFRLVTAQENGQTDVLALGFF